MNIYFASECQSYEAGYGMVTPLASVFSIIVYNDGKKTIYRNSDESDPSENGTKYHVIIFESLYKVLSHSLPSDTVENVKLHIEGTKDEGSTYDRLYLTLNSYARIWSANGWRKKNNEPPIGVDAIKKLYNIYNMHRFEWSVFDGKTTNVPIQLQTYNGLKAMSSADRATESFEDL